MGVSSGAEGITGGAPPSDLEAIYQGGQFFLDRMKAMGDARDGARQALDALALGNDIAATRAAVAVELDKAKACTVDAQAALAAAQNRAASIIDDAQSQARVLIDAAQQKAEDMVRTADAIKADADAYGAQARANADAVTVEANERLRDITVNADAIKAKVEAADKAKSEAEAARTRLDAARTVYEQKVAQLQAVVAAPDTAG